VRCSVSRRGSPDRTLDVLVLDIEDPLTKLPMLARQPLQRGYRLRRRDRHFRLSLPQLTSLRGGFADRRLLRHRQRGRIVAELAGDAGFNLGEFRGTGLMERFDLRCLGLGQLADIVVIPVWVVKSSLRAGLPGS